ncbi:family 65 glycosyl hydrolase [Solirubrobacter sp. CPCC 204708]|uniref:Family 65 glycosyl hydrolase n=1 Tax=Solirubrobacter deserti TaxID=2282478 RepID=A0ABT4RHN5_9ACTN|nr:glycosyl hydrolase family 65 protein [Solirubrobacter deserti]MDA0138061.1 family 65 glycosyl hydrolase [Solirubrobacter deserti]
MRSTRLVSLTQRAIAAIRYEVEPIDGPARIVVQSELATGDPALQGEIHRAEGVRALLVHRTRCSGVCLAAAMHHTVDGKADVATDAEPDLARVTFSARLQPNEQLRIDKHLAYGWSATRSPSALRDQVEAALTQARFDELAAAQRAFLDRAWELADVELDGDPELQQALRFAAFHIIQASARAERRPIPAKGLTGTGGYSGHTMWDMDSYTLPVLTRIAPETARDALLWRHSTLDHARERAAELDLDGVSFPWRTIAGDECSGYWPAGTAAFHINADVADAVRRYVAATGDEAFEREAGLDLLVGTARLWHSLGRYDRDGSFRIGNVTGPDEYTALVENNTYTNLMAARNLRAAADAAVRHRPRAAALGVDDDELAGWRKAAEAMRVPYDAELQITQQSEGFTHLRPWTFDEHDRTLMHHNHYVRLYGAQVLKQADLVHALYVCGDHFSPEQKARDFEYYERINVRDSSLSAPIQGIVAAEVGHLDLAYAYLQECALIDLEDHSGNTGEGVHLAALAGAWLVVVAGFGGLRDHGDELTFAPRRPSRLTGISFRVQHRGRLIRVRIAETAAYELLEGEPLELVHHGERVTVRDRLELKIPDAPIHPTPAQPPGREPPRRNRT